MLIAEFLDKVNQYILNPIIILAFVVAIIVFTWGIFEFISSETADASREKGKSKILWGLFGMFIMISAYGLIRLILDTIGVRGPEYLDRL